MADREADAGRDRGALALTARVEDAHGHDLRAVGEPGDAAVVVRALADRAGHVGAVAVLVVREPVLVHEVVARHEVAAREVGRPAEAPAVRVGDAGVEHRDGGAAAARMPEVEQVLPGVGRVDARGGEEVPLQVLPAAVAAGAARIARDEGGQVRAGVRRGGRDLGAPPQLAHRVGHALAVADRQHARARGEGLRSSDAGRALHGRLLAPAGAALVADDHLAGRVGRGARGLGAGRGGHHQHGGGDEGSDQAGRLQHEVAATVPPRAVRLTYNIVGTPKLRNKP